MQKLATNYISYGSMNRNVLQKICIEEISKNGCTAQIDINIIPHERAGMESTYDNTLFLHVVRATVARDKPQPLAVYKEELHAV